MHADSSDIQLTYELNKTPVCSVQVITEMEGKKQMLVAIHENIERELNCVE